MLKLADLKGLLRADPSGLLRVDHIDTFLWRQQWPTPRMNDNYQGYYQDSNIK
jgi:hypothetical protein